MQLHDFIRTIPDYPREGVDYKDITPLLNHPEAYQQAVKELLGTVNRPKVDKVVGIESRGFIFGAALADRLRVGFIPMRKKGKLPAKTYQKEYKLEYGTDILEVHQDAIAPGEKVIIHDDLLATGGTAVAACHLVEQMGGEIVQVSFLVELLFLKGREQLSGYQIDSILTY
ncbi:MAG: adenine phosphoribosyltransferase [Cyclobacteriaceae bacterium]